MYSVLMSVSRSILARSRFISDQMEQDELLVILDELEKVIRNGVEGDVVELGCYEGSTSVLFRQMLEELGSTKELHVYDSFQGLPHKSPEDDSPLGEAFLPGSLSAPVSVLEKKFSQAGLRYPVIHKGWFADMTNHDMPHQISFALADGDFYSSVKESLELVWPHLSRGGVIVVDDYGNDKLPGVRVATDEFCRGRGEPFVIQSLAIIKKTGH